MKHWRYFVYLARHKWFVFVAGLQTKAPLWRLVIHDWSKFLPCEWFPYADFFYGCKLRSITEVHGDERNHVNRFRENQAEDFDRAWLHHQHANPHHWQHWVLREDSGAVKIIEMPEHFAREMVADWMGAGRAITGKWESRQWYEKNRSVIQLAESTRILVEWLLPAATKETAR